MLSDASAWVPEMLRMHAIVVRTLAKQLTFYTLYVDKIMACLPAASDLNDLSTSVNSF